MDKQNIKVFFLGSGVFAVPVLEALHKSSRIDVIGVATQLDKEAGRKRILTPTPLGKWADSAGMDCLRVQSVNKPEFLDVIHDAAPDIVVVVSFGQLLRETLLNLPKFGCFNVHASLLPRFRGASPITSAVLSGDEQTGVSFMRMDKGLDTGPVYEMLRCPVSPQITTGELERDLSLLAAEHIEDCLLRVTDGLQPYPQSTENISVTGKIRKSDGSVDFREDAMLLVRKVRAFYGWPSMTFRLPLRNRTINVKITRAKGTSWESPKAQPGEFIAYSNNQMMIRCGKGSLVIERVLPEGKKEMPVSDFLNGCHISVGALLLNGIDRE